MPEYSQALLQGYSVNAGVLEETKARTTAFRYGLKRDLGDCTHQQLCLHPKNNDLQ
jgi:hypothetical protein